MERQAARLDAATADKQMQGGEKRNEPLGISMLTAADSRTDQCDTRTRTRSV